ncbi:MAG TPA: hypothetical protein PK559_10270 [Ignavibacteriaceae bacterium]|nr:hypothetical protein [Ignavibacteriaceae bacterium]
MISSKIAANILIGLITLVILFHISVIVKLIPFEIVWGGQITTEQEMYLFEVVSILINALLLLTILIKVNYITLSIPLKVVDVILWVFVWLFLINTMGNLFAETYIEKSFSLLTLVFSFLIWRIVRDGKRE